MHATSPCAHAGKIYAYNGDEALHNRTTPIWVSNFICSKREGMQHQMFGVNSTAGVLLVRCNSDIAVVSLADGRLRLRHRDRFADPRFPVPMATTTTALSYKANRLTALSTSRLGGIPWARDLPGKEYNISSVDARDGIIVTTGVNSPTMYILSRWGRCSC